NDAAGGDDAANEDNAAANEAAGSAAEVHLIPHSPSVSPVREPTPERQPVSERPPSPSPTIPTLEPPRPHGYVDPDFVEPIIFGPQPRPDNYLAEDAQANLSAGVLPHTAVPEPAGPSVAADKGKVPMPDLDIPAEFLVEDAQARKCFEEEQASERLVQRLRAEDLTQEDLPNVSEERAKELDDLMMRMTETDELLGAYVNEENFIERMNAVKEKKKRALADLRYRALKGKPMKKSE
ncbi:hypothetical protein Tco_0159568, partial [Tanacetum coccineum]